MEINTQEENAVFIKKEHMDSPDIKEEPSDEYYSYAAIENVMVKMEPCADEETQEDRFYTLPERPSSPLKEPSRPKRLKKKVVYDSDKDYIDETSKKKGKELVKKTYTTKAKKAENDFSEEITQHIEVINISEEERLLEFKETWHTRQHMRYKCELCAIGYVTEEPYATHMLLHSPASGDHECDICQCRMQTAETLYRHRLRHYRRYRCSLCHALHKEKEMAASHIMTEHCGRAFVCTHCGKGFKRPTYLKKHIAQQHTKLERHECHVCQRVFHDKTSLRSHVRTHDSRTRHPPAQTVVCDTCSARFAGKARLRRHVRVHAARRREPCACGALFATRRGLQLHWEKKHAAAAAGEGGDAAPAQGMTSANRERPVTPGPEDQPRPNQRAQSARPQLIIMKEAAGDELVFAEPEPKQWTPPTNMLTHKVLPTPGGSLPVAGGAPLDRTPRGANRTKKELELSHHVERAPCPLCAQVCTNAALLRQHMRRMHSDRTKKYQCDHCQRHYFSKGEVRAHIAWSHLRLRAAAHACRCGRAFRTRARLRHHEDLHHRRIVPERTHLCHCGKGFTSKQVLSRHMKTHEGLTYPCPECDLRFKSEAYVKVHHQLRHLNMTRAQIKALKQPRELTYITGMKPMKQVNSDKVNSGKVKKRKVKKVEVAAENVTECISVPLFDFVDLKREILDSPQEFEYE